MIVYFERDRDSECVCVLRGAGDCRMVYARTEVRVDDMQ